jgi:hypothetical protein
MALSALQNPVFWRAIAVPREAVHGAIDPPGQVYFVLLAADLTDEALRNSMNGARNAVTLSEEDLVILRYVGIEHRVG